MFDAGGGEAYSALDADAFFAKEAAAVDQAACAAAVVADAKGILGVGQRGAQPDSAGAAFEEQHDVAGPFELGMSPPVDDDVAPPVERRVELIGRRRPRPLSVFFPLSRHDQGA